MTRVLRRLIRRFQYICRNILDLRKETTNLIRCLVNKRVKILKGFEVANGDKKSSKKKQKCKAKRYLIFDLDVLFRFKLPSTERSTKLNSPHLVKQRWLSPDFQHHLQVLRL